MRIWSLHPKYLDAKGLVALWRETLLAKKVLSGQTKGYRHHPQLIRFAELDDPVSVLDNYLAGVYKESLKRAYNFDRSKIDWNFSKARLEVSRDQLKYEWEHLMRKLDHRANKVYERLKNVPPAQIEVHPVFHLVDGPIAHWEIVIQNDMSVA